MSPPHRMPLYIRSIERGKALSVREEVGTTASAKNTVAPQRRGALPLLGRHKQRMADEWQRLQDTRGRLVQSQSVLQQQHARLVQFSQQWGAYARQVEARAQETARRQEGLDERERELVADQQRVSEERVVQERLDAELADRNLALRAQAENLELESERLSAEAKRLVAAELSTREQADEVAARRAELEGQQTELDLERARVRDEQHAAAAVRQQLDEQSRELDGRASLAASEREELRRDQAQFAADQRQLRVQWGELEAARSAFDATAATRSAELDKLRNQTELEAAEASRARAELARRRQEVDGQADKLLAERARLDQAAADQEHELASSRRELEAARAELDEQSQALTNELEQLREWGEHLAGQAKSLEAEAGRLGELEFQPPDLDTSSTPARPELTPRAGALQLLDELDPAKAASLLLAYDEAGVAPLPASTRDGVTAVAALLNYDGRAAIARVGRLSSLPAEVGLSAALLSRRKLEMGLDAIERLDWPAIDELLERRAIDLDTAMRLGAEDADVVRARLGDVTLSTEAAVRVGWTTEVLRRQLTGEAAEEASGEAAALVLALKSAAAGDFMPLVELQSVPDEYGPLAELVRAVRSAASEPVAMPEALAADVTLWPLLGYLLVTHPSVQPPGGNFGAWSSLLLARRWVRVGDLRAAAAEVVVAQGIDSPWCAEAWMLAGYLALRASQGDEAQRCLDEAVAADPTLYATVEHNRDAIERARARGEWISPLVVLGLGEDESPRAAARAWGARIRDAKLLEAELQDDRNADLNWALETVEGETSEPWFRLSTDLDLPRPEGHGLLNPSPRPLPRLADYGVADVHRAAARWLDSIVAGLLTGATSEQGKALDA